MKKILFLLTLLISFSSFSTNYYISPTGNNTNNGTSSGTPKLTLAHVFSTYNLGSNDTIFVAAGTYTETGTTVGTDDEGFVIQGASLSGGVPTSIFDASSTARWLLLGNTNNDNIKINRLIIKDHKQSTGSGPNEGGGGIKIITGATGLVVTYCHFDNCDTRTNFTQNSGGAIYSQEGFTVSFCTFKNCNAEYYGGAIATTLSPTTNTQIDHCTFYSNVATNYGGAIFFGVGSNSTLTLENCLFYENNTSSGEAVIVSMNTYSTLNIMNCTITANGNASVGTGGVLALSSAKINLTNTIIYNNLGNTFNDVYNNAATVNMTNCCYGNSAEIKSATSNISPLISNPLFTNSASDDYTLSSTSPCIDWGTTTGSPTDDLRHYSRIGNPDAGCFESNGVALPIELLYFKPYFDDGVVKLKWSTASEQNNDYFTIEKSKDGLDYIIVTTLPGAGNSVYKIDYQAVDRDIEPGILYYRLKQTDINGEFKRTDWSSILIQLNIKNLAIYPNPATNEINVLLNSTLNKVEELLVYDLTGKLFYKKSLDLKVGDNYFNVELPQLSSGLYILKIGDKELKLEY
jgi:hypothetical protein